MLKAKVANHLAPSTLSTILVVLTLHGHLNFLPIVMQLCTTYPYTTSYDASNIFHFFYKGVLIISGSLSRHC